LVLIDFAVDAEAACTIFFSVTVIRSLASGGRGTGAAAGVAECVGRLELVAAAAGFPGAIADGTGFAELANDGTEDDATTRAPTFFPAGAAF